MADPPNKSNRAPLGSRPFVQLAKRLVLERDYGQAVDICRQGLLVSPEEVEGRVVLCMALLALGRADDVLAEIRIAIEQEPGNPIAHVLKGEAYYRRGEYTRAEEALNCARRLDPQNPRADTLLRQVAAERQAEGETGSATDPATRIYPASQGSGPDVLSELSSPADRDTDRISGGPEIPDLRFAGEDEDVETVAYPAGQTPAGQLPPVGQETLDVSVASATPRLEPPMVANHQYQDATVQDPPSGRAVPANSVADYQDASEQDSTRHYRPNDPSPASSPEPYDHGERLPETLGSTWGDLVGSQRPRSHTEHEPYAGEAADVDEDFSVAQDPGRVSSGDESPRYRAPEYLEETGESSASVVTDFSALGIEMLADSKVEPLSNAVVDHGDAETDAMTRVHFSDAKSEANANANYQDHRDSPELSSPVDPQKPQAIRVDSRDKQPFESLEDDAWMPREPTAELSAFEGRASSEQISDLGSEPPVNPKQTAAAERYRQPSLARGPRIDAPRAVVPQPSDSEAFLQGDSQLRRDPKGTSFLQIIVGAKGSHRWIYWLIGITTVLALAWVMGRWVRSSRLGDRANRKLKDAVTRTQQGNIGDYRAALEAYGQILSRSADSLEARRHQALAKAAIPFEFGLPLGEAGASLEAFDEQTKLTIRAYRQFGAGQFDQAKASLSAVAATESGRLLYLKGRLALLRFDYATAVSLLQKATQKRPGDLLIRRSLAEALLASGEVSRAEQINTQILSKNPDQISTLLASALASISGRTAVGDPRQTLRSVVEGPRRGLSSIGQIAWAKLLLSSVENSEKAEVMLVEAEKDAPRNDPAFLDILLGVHLAKWRLDRAEILLATNEKGMSSLPFWAFRKTELELAKGKLGAARSLLQPWVKGKRSAGLMARIELASGQVALARNALAPHFAKTNTSMEPRMKLVLAELLTAEGKLDEAENLAQSLLAAGARYPRLGLILGDIDLRSGNMEKSLTHYRAVLKAYPQSLPAKLKTGLIYYLQGDVVRAQEILAALEGEATSLPRVAGMQAFFSFGLFRLEEAEKQLKGLLKAEPSNQYLSKQLLATLLARRDYTAASALLGRTTGLDGVDKSMALGKIALGQFRATAEAHFLEAAARGSRGAEASELLLRFYLQANQGRKAQRLADSIAKKFPENPEALRAQGRADLFSGAFDSSRSWIDRALSVGKRHGRPPSWFSETLLLRGQTKQEQGKSRAAQKDYRLAKDRCPACAGPYWRLGLLLDEAGKSKAAINALRHALERDSRWPRPYYDLARAFDNAGKTEEAKRMYRKFLSFSPPAHLAKDARQAIAALQ